MTFMRIIFYFACRNIEAGNNVVQRNSALSSHDVNTEFLNENSSENFIRRTRPADTEDSESTDNVLKDNSEGNVCFTVSNTRCNKYECIMIRSLHVKPVPYTV